MQYVRQVIDIDEVVDPSKYQIESVSINLEETVPEINSTPTSSSHLASKTSLWIPMPLVSVQKAVLASVSINIIVPHSQGMINVSAGSSSKLLPSVDTLCIIERL